MEAEASAAGKMAAEAKHEKVPLIVHGVCMHGCFLNIYIIMYIIIYIWMDIYRIGYKLYLKCDIFGIPFIYWDYLKQCRDICLKV